MLLHAASRLHNRLACGRYVQPTLEYPGRVPRSKKAKRRPAAAAGPDEGNWPGFLDLANLLWPADVLRAVDKARAESDLHRPHADVGFKRILDATLGELENQIRLNDLFDYERDWKTN